MKKYFISLAVLALILGPGLAHAQVSSTTSKLVVPKSAPVLKKPTKPTATATTSTVVKPTKVSILKRGSRDAGDNLAVRNLQAFLNNVLGTNIDVDGIFGRGTEAAVKQFQKSIGLTADGLVGSQTALAISKMPKAVPVTELDKDTLKYFADSAKKDAKVARTTIAALPYGIASVLEKALPAAPVLTRVASAVNLNSQTVVTSDAGAQILTRKPKSSAVDFARASFYIASGNSNPVVTGSNLAKNYSSGEAAAATSKYICADFDNDRDGRADDQMCGAVSNEVAAAVEAGQISARDALIVALGLDGVGGSCPICSGNANGGISVVGGSSANGSCPFSGGPGSGEFVTPPGTPVPGNPQCIPKSQIAGKPVTLKFTGDNVFSVYFETTDNNGNKNLELKLSDMNWDTGTDTNLDGINDFGWKSGETWSGLAPNNISAIYYALFDDDWIASGLLGETIINGVSYLTGVSPNYEAAVSTVPGPVHPNPFNIATLASQFAAAAWHNSSYIADHGDSPWGDISGIPADARWINESVTFNSDFFPFYRLAVCGEENTPPATVIEVTENCQGDLGPAPWPSPGQYFSAAVKFSEPVVVTGSPKIVIKTANGADGITLNYAYGSGGTVLTFTYIVPFPALPSGYPYVKDDFMGDYAFVLPLSSGTSIKTVSGSRDVVLVGQWTAPDGPLCPVDTGDPTDSSEYTIADLAQATCLTTNVVDVLGHKYIEVTMGTDKPVFVQGTPDFKAYSLASNNPIPQLYVPYLSGAWSNQLKFNYSQESGVPDEAFDLANVNTWFDFRINTGEAIKTVSLDGTTAYPHAINLNGNLPACSGGPTIVVPH